MTSTEQISPKQTQNGPAATVSTRGKVAYGIMVAGGIGLAVTGIGTFVLGSPPMTHWMLMAHVAAAPVFAVGLALVALTWAERSRFGETGSRQGCFSKALLWLILLCGLVVLLSGVVPMTPVFGTNGQHLLYLIHRYSGIAITVIVILHLLSLKSAR